LGHVAQCGAAGSNRTRSADCGKANKQIANRSWKIQTSQSQEARLSASPQKVRLTRTIRFMYIDSHCHINFPDLAARLPAILDKMAENQVSHALCVAVDLPDFPGVLALAEQHANIYASVGVHPDYEETPEPTVEELVRLSAHPKIVAIGET